MIVKGAPVVSIWNATYGLAIPAAIAAAAWRWAPPPSSFLVDSILGGVLDALGNLAMLAALRVTDLSVFGPLNAIRPILALLFGWIFLREQPSLAGVFGIGITVFGAWVVLKDDRADSSGRGSVWKVLGFRLLGFALSTAASVFLKRAAGTVSAEMTLAGWFICGWVCLLIYAAAKREKLFDTESGQGKWLVGHAVVFFAMQWLTIKVFQTTLLSYAFVFFQLGMVLQTIAGRIFFNEQQFRRRMVGCVVMATGAALIILRG